MAYSQMLAPFIVGSYERFMATTPDAEFAQLVEEYGRLSGRDVSGMLFYYCFALFKLIGIIQQLDNPIETVFVHEGRQQR